MTTSEKVDVIFPALIKAQSEMGNAKKSCDNPFYKSKYADLSELIDVTKKVLFSNKMAIIQSPEGTGNTASINCRIIHESGQWVEGTITLPLAKCDPQAAGSAITYGRRYQLAALFNIAQEDDDANDTLPPDEFTVLKDALEKKIQTGAFTHPENVRTVIKMRDINQMKKALELTKEKEGKK